MLDTATWVVISTNISILSSNFIIIGIIIKFSTSIFIEYHYHLNCYYNFIKKIISIITWITILLSTKITPAPTPPPPLNKCGTAQHPNAPPLKTEPWGSQMQPRPSSDQKWKHVATKPKGAPS